MICLGHLAMNISNFQLYAVSENEFRVRQAEEDSVYFYSLLTIRNLVTKNILNYVNINFAPSALQRNLFY